MYSNSHGQVLTQFEKHMFAVCVYMFQVLSVMWHLKYTYTETLLTDGFQLCEFYHAAWIVIKFVIVYFEIQDFRQVMCEDNYRYV
jgi:hypothetical protein